MVIAAAVFVITALYFALSPQQPPAQKFLNTLSNEVLGGINISFDQSAPEQAPQARKKGNAITLNNLELGEDGLGRIESLQISFSPWYSLRGFWSVSKPTKIIIEGLNIDFVYEDLAAPQIALSLPIIMAKALESAATIELKNTVINVSTPDYGVWQFRLNGSFQDNGEREGKSYFLRLETAQKPFSAELTLTGALERGLMSWNSEVTIETMRFEIEPFIARRMSGFLSLAGAADHINYALGEMNISSLSYGDITFREMAASLDHSAGKTKLVLAGAAAQSDDLEFGVQYNSDEPDLLTFTAYAANMQDLLNFLMPERFPQTTEAQALKISHYQDVFVTANIPKAQIFLEEKNIRMTFDNINLENFSKIFGSDFEAQGNARAQFIINAHDRDFKVSKGVIVSGGAGHFSFDRKALQHVLTKNVAPELRDILSDTHYNSFKIQIEGDALGKDSVALSVELQPRAEDAQATQFTIEKLFSGLSDFLFKEIQD
ncbi:MAG: YdbH domain-containing protein [Alphaproteobacteria bacterium]